MFITKGAQGRVVQQLSVEETKPNEFSDPGAMHTLSNMKYEGFNQSNIQMLSQIKYANKIQLREN